LDALRSLVDATDDPGLARNFRWLAGVSSLLPARRAWTDARRIWRASGIPWVPAAILRRGRTRITMRA